MTKMKDFFDGYVVEFDWKDVTLMKICMCTFGILLGMNVKYKQKWITRFFASLCFLGTAILLCMRALDIAYPEPEVVEMEDMEAVEELEVVADIETMKKEESAEMIEPVEETAMAMEA